MSQPCFARLVFTQERDFDFHNSMGGLISGVHDGMLILDGVAEQPRLLQATREQAHSQQIVIARRICTFAYMVIQKPGKMLSLPGSWVVPLPAFIDCRMDHLCLTKVTLAGGMRPGQNTSQKQPYIERLSHDRPPM
jgi:hypothetical protein